MTHILVIPADGTGPICMDVTGETATHYELWDGQLAWRVAKADVLNGTALGRTVWLIEN